MLTSLFQSQTDPPQSHQTKAFFAIYLLLRIRQKGIRGWQAASAKTFQVFPIEGDERENLIPKGGNQCLTT